MISPDGPGCGQDDHKAECLCDVVVKASSPINNTLALRAAVRAVNYSRGEIGLLETLASIAAAREASEATKGMVEGYLALDDRERILELLREGHSIIDVPSMLGEVVKGQPYTLKTVVQVLTLNIARRIWMWNETDWLRFEAHLVDGRPRTKYAWCKLFGLMNTHPLDALEGWYGRELPRGEGRMSMKLAVLMRDWDENAHSVAEALVDDYPSITAKHVSGIRSTVRSGHPIRCPEDMRHLLRLPAAA